MDKKTEVPFRLFQAFALLSGLGLIILLALMIVFPFTYGLADYVEQLEIQLVLLKVMLCDAAVIFSSIIIALFIATLAPTKK